VEQRFIDNQLKNFRQQLSRQFQRSKSHRVPPTKPDFKLNHAPLVKSLAQAAQHIDNFYNTPVQALGEMAQMCSETKSVATKSLIQQLRAEPEKEADMDCEWVEQEGQVMEIPEFLEEQVISFDALEYRNFTKQVQADESKAKLLRCRTPSPLTSTEEFFRPMRAAAERQMLHVRTVRHEEELQQENKQEQDQQPEGNPSSLKRESSTCSNTSDGIGNSTRSSTRWWARAARRPRRWAWTRST